MNCKTRINKVIDFPVEFFFVVVLPVKWWSTYWRMEPDGVVWKNIIWMETNSKSKKDCFGYGYPAKNKFVTEKNDRDFKQTQFSFFR